ncbi:MAG: hypothetical protein PVS2B2_00230 [Candidatus Acidiferrum sp.]
MSTHRSTEILRDFTFMREQRMETPEIIEAAQDVLSQGLGLLLDLGDHTYSRVVAAPISASIGQHYRHVLEHFQRLLQGLRTGEINYDARERNLRMQTEVAYASLTTCDILRELKLWTNGTLEGNCKVISIVGFRSSRPSCLESNIGRELAYCVGHAIHHYAIIRLVSGAIGISVPEEFGFAPATLHHMSTLAAD